MARAGRGNQSLWWQELQPWMNLYLPSIKPAKKVRLASKLRRVIHPGTDAFGAGRSLRSGGLADDGTEEALLHPGSLSISQPQRSQAGEISALCPTGGLRPRPANSRCATAVEKLRRGKVGKRTFPPLGIPQKTQDSHFPTATTGGIRSRSFSMS